MQRAHVTATLVSRKCADQIAVIAELLCIIQLTAGKSLLSKHLYQTTRCCGPQAHCLHLHSKRQKSSCPNSHGQQT